MYWKLDYVIMVFLCWDFDVLGLCTLILWVLYSIIKCIYWRLEICFPTWNPHSFFLKLNLNYKIELVLLRYLRNFAAKTTEFPYSECEDPIDLWRSSWETSNCWDREKGNGFKFKLHVLTLITIRIRAIYMLLLPFH